MESFVNNFARSATAAAAAAQTAATSSRRSAFHIRPQTQITASDVRPHIQRQSAILCAQRQHSLSHTRHFRHTRGHQAQERGRRRRIEASRRRHGAQCRVGRQLDEAQRRRSQADLNAYRAFQTVHKLRDTSRGRTRPQMTTMKPCWRPRPKC